MADETDEKVKITIARDLLSAYVTFRRPEGGKLLTYGQLASLVEEAKVTYGVNHEELRRLAGNPDKEYDQEIVIAAGLPPDDGHNARIEFRFRIAREITPKVLPDGSVDHHALDYAESVRKGGVLAEMSKESEGTAGINVFGEEIPAKPGKPRVLPQGKNTEISGDGLKLLAG